MAKYLMQLKIRDRGMDDYGLDGQLTYLNNLYFFETEDLTEEVIYAKVLEIILSKKENDFKKIEHRYNIIENELVFSGVVRVDEWNITYIITKEIIEEKVDKYLTHPSEGVRDLAKYIIARRK